MESEFVSIAEEEIAQNTFNRDQNSPPSLEDMALLFTNAKRHLGGLKTIKSARLAEAIAAADYEVNKLTSRLYAAETDSTTQRILKDTAMASSEECGAICSPGWSSVNWTTAAGLPKRVLSYGLTEPCRCSVVWW